MQNESDSVNYKSLLLFVFKTLQITWELTEVNSRPPFENKNEIKKKRIDDIINCDTATLSLNLTDKEALAARLSAYDSVHQSNIIGILTRLENSLSSRGDYIYWPCYDGLDLNFFENAAVFYFVP